MILELIYTGCRARGAYYIQSNGEAAIIDLLREVSPHIERAAKNNARIKYFLETHFNADFVYGYIDQSKQSGAETVYWPKTNCSHSGRTF